MTLGKDDIKFLNDEDKRWMLSKTILRSGQSAMLANQLKISPSVRETAVLRNSAPLDVAETDVVLIMVRMGCILTPGG